MQTFLPYPDFVQSARVLDWRRLGKQRVEADQILNIVSGNTTKRGWVNHPATLIWLGYKDALIVYRNTMIREWIRRGYVNNMPLLEEVENPVLPPIIGREDYHLSHQSNLIRKFPEHYSPEFPGVEPDLPYVWK